MMLYHVVSSASVLGRTVVLDVNLLREHFKETLTSGCLPRLPITLAVFHLSLQQVRQMVCCSIKALHSKVIFKLDSDTNNVQVWDSKFA
jgi:hypothetical protein